MENARGNCREFVNQGSFTRLLKVTICHLEMSDMVTLQYKIVYCLPVWCRNLDM